MTGFAIAIILIAILAFVAAICLLRFVLAAAITVCVVLLIGLSLSTCEGPMAERPNYPAKVISTIEQAFTDSNARDQARRARMVPDHRYIATMDSDSECRPGWRFANERDGCVHVSGTPEQASQWMLEHDWLPHKPKFGDLPYE